MTKIANVFNDLQQYLEKVGVSLSAMILIIILFFVILGVIWLVLRNVKLWYWKVNTQVEALKRIEDRLAHVESKVIEGIPLVEEKEPDIVSKIEIEEELSNVENLEPTLYSQIYIERADNVSKTGRVYTQEELERQIQE